jgi:hypothetical protein
MPVHLPDDLLTRVKPLLLPYLRDKAERSLKGCRLLAHWTWVGMCLSGY